jgi:hypothetical protein
LALLLTCLSLLGQIAGPGLPYLPSLASTWSITICTADGASTVHFPSDAPPAPDPSHHHHCLPCCLGIPALLGPPEGVALRPLLTVRLARSSPPSSLNWWIEDRRRRPPGRAPPQAPA